jgi:hypothetical protein
MIDNVDNLVEGLLVSGATEQQVRKTVLAQYPNVDADQVIEQAVKAMGQVPSQDELRGWLVRANRQLYRRLVEAGSYDDARKCLSEIANLGGLS